ncbi:hypothetical protein HMSSN036_41740 [Paenibacillus macerans]|nr:hypothetical protein HMSSN036_41740 [Paenibacillus macerans]
MFGLEMKVGEKRPYIVKNIRDFLDKAGRREPFVFSKHFCYDPDRHSFLPADEQLLQQLIEINRNERMYTETLGGYMPAKKYGNGDRLLPIPPFFGTACCLC